MTEIELLTAENKQLYKDIAELKLQVYQLTNRLQNHTRLILGYQNELMGLKNAATTVVQTH